jgi:hypothetical protein
MTTRRTLLAAGGGLVALGLAGMGGSLVWCNRASLAALPLDRLDVALADMPWAARIGRAYREAEGIADIEAAFLGRPALARATLIDCDSTRRTALRTAFREGFRSGDVVTLDRVLVSRAEGVVAALRAA